MSIANILVLCGGNSSEREISLISAQYILKTLSEFCQFRVTKKEIAKDEAINPTIFKDIDYVIPALHGYPGETGDISSLLDLLQIPYLGCNSESSKICFNKVTTKLWLKSLDIPNTPFIFLSSPSELDKAEIFLKLHKEIFLKSSSQGSSIGCYQVKNMSELKTSVEDAFTHSPYVLIEKSLKARELEVSVFEVNGELHITKPGEVISPSHFYSYEEKYNSNSQSKTQIEAENISEEIHEQINHYCKLAFRSLKLKDLCRVDFFLDDHDTLYLNEINTFPGMTPISMFPKMMENSGTKFSKFLEKAISKSLKDV